MSKAEDIRVLKDSIQTYTRALREAKEELEKATRENAKWEKNRQVQYIEGKQIKSGSTVININGSISNCVVGNNVGHTMIVNGSVQKPYGDSKIQDIKAAIKVFEEQLAAKEKQLQELER